MYHVYDYLHRWVLISLDKSEEEEVVVSANPRVPHLSGKKWEAATHKVNVVHEVGEQICENYWSENETHL